MPGKKKLIGVQYLRAVAALMVAYYHLIGQIPPYSPDFSFAHFLSSQRLPTGVDIFFVISGFIMYVTGRGLSAGEFASRRFTRIVPLYWILTLAICAIAMLDAAALRRTDVTIEYAAKSLLFIPYHNPGEHNLLFPMLVPGWTLNYEMAFYALFGVALLLPKYRMRTLVILLLVLVAGGMIWSRPEMFDRWGFYTSNRLALFAAGIVLGGIYTAGILQIPRLLCGGLVLAGFWGALTNWQPVATDRWLELASAVAIVVGVVAWEGQFGIPRWRVPLLLGDASYSIYLAHPFAFGITRTAWRHLNGPPWAFAILSMLVAIALAIATYRLIEQPTVHWLAGRPSASRFAWGRRAESTIGLQEQSPGDG